MQKKKDLLHKHKVCKTEKSQNHLQEKKKSCKLLQACRGRVLWSLYVCLKMQFTGVFLLMSDFSSVVQMAAECLPSQATVGSTDCIKSADL